MLPSSNNIMAEEKDDNIVFFTWNQIVFQIVWKE